MRAAVRRAFHAPRLPLSTADFGRRGFRTDRLVAREALEGHARSFLTGFNTAVGEWRAPHAALDRLADEERGFAYEGAGMFARIADLATDEAGRAELVRASGTHRPHLAQGVAFAAGARVRSGIVPEHTRAACAQILGVDPEQAAAWTDAAAEGLTDSRHVHAYLRWRARVRALAAPVTPS